MAISEATQDAVRALWVLGSDHGRPPSPTPEADPWQDEDPFEEPQDTAVVEFGGVPTIEVRLNGDLEDEVTLQGAMVFDVPRRDTVAFVAAVLEGDAYLRLLGSHLPDFLRGVLGFMAGKVLVVPVRGASYEQPWPYRMIEVESPWAPPTR